MNYYNINSEPKEFQRKAAEHCYETILKDSAAFLHAPVGTGKTYMSLLVAVAYMRDELSKLGPAKAFTNPSILVVTPKAVCANFMADAKNFFGLQAPDLQVISYSSLRSSAGKSLVEEVLRKDINTDDADGERVVQFQWKKSIRPGIIIFDECQSMNNLGSQQHELGVEACALLTPCALRAALKLPAHLCNTKIIFMSATAATKACHLDVMMRARVHANPKAGVFFGIDKAGPLLSLTDKPLPSYKHQKAKALMSAICGGSDPNSLSQNAMKAMVAFLEPITHRVPPITTKWKNKMSIKLYSPSPEEKQQIDKAIADYQAELAALGKSGPGVSRMKQVAMLKLRMRCEIVRAPLLASFIDRDIKAGFQPVIGVEFKNTIARIVLCLIRDYGYSREQLCLIWGGDDVYAQDPVEVSNEELFNLISQALKGEEFDSSRLDAIINQVKVNYSGMKEDITELQRLKINLSAQTTEQRNVEIDDLQQGKRLAAIASFKAGSVGINLNHSDKFFRVRPERYAVTLMPNTRHGMEVLDKQTGTTAIPLPLPRRAYLAPTWSPLNFLQFKGRAHRIDSISSTEQEVVLYKNTIEEVIALTLGKHFMNARTLARANEDWSNLLEDAVFGKHDIKADEISEESNEINETEDTGEE